MVWYTRPETRHVAFRNKSFDGDKAGSCPLPGLVFFVKNDAWFVFAYAGKARPTEKTRLLRSPFFNVWQAGRICVGNIDLPKQRVNAPVEQWEDAFFGTWFTHPNVPQDQLLKKGPTRLSSGRSCWKASIKPFRRACSSQLVPRWVRCSTSWFGGTSDGFS